jgi:hypothetical protein
VNIPLFVVPFLDVAGALNAGHITRCKSHPAVAQGVCPNLQATTLAFSVSFLGRSAPSSPSHPEAIQALWLAFDCFRPRVERALTLPFARALYI